MVRFLGGAVFFVLEGGRPNFERRCSMSTVDEVGRTARLAITSWGRTVRLAFLLMAVAIAYGLFLAIQQLVLIML
jgi:hypothetical protein